MSVLKGLKRFFRNDKGTTAVLFGLAAVPLAGAAGVAVDYSRSLTLRAGLQKAADQAALMAVYAEFQKRPFDLQSVYRGALGETAKNLLDSGGVDGAPAYKVSGRWIVPGREYAVTVAGTTAGTLVRALIPGKMLDVGVYAAAVGTQEATEVKITGANLDPEAWDYNETQAYCYHGKDKKRLGPLDPKTGERKPYVKIADNTEAGVKAGLLATSILCGEGEQVSFLVKNVRDARKYPSKLTTGTPRYFYTDAVREKESDPIRYAVTYDGVARDTLETILCKKSGDCRPQSQGGILPNNHQINRTPSVNAQACKKGDQIYFGWEDRIPGVSGDDSDRDFDDIRMYMSCPVKELGPLRVRLSA